MSVNKFIGIGNVTKEPDVKRFENSIVANFTLAINERGYTSANGTVVPDRVEFINIVLWRGLAEIAEKYVRKGSKVYIEGKIKTRSYDTSDGSKRYVTEIWGDNMELLTPRSQEQGQSAPAYEAPAERPQQTAQVSAPVEDDGLPF